MKFIIGRKIEMTQKFDERANVVPVTVLKAWSCIVTQVKTVEKDGYNSVQVAFGDRKKMSKPQLGHIKSVSSFFEKAPLMFKEFKCENVDGFEVGQVIDPSILEKGDFLTIKGISKGKGFAGVVKRHGFKGSPASHGHKDQLRMPGSIGSVDSARVFKGTRMGGRMGTDSVTVKNVLLFDLDLESDLLYVKGPIPGSRNSIVFITTKGEMKLEKFDSKKEKVEDIKKEVDVTAEVSEISPKDNIEEGNK